MIYKGTLLTIIDNSGIKIGKCIGIYNSREKQGAILGEIILISLQKILGKTKFIKGDLIRALIVRHKKKIKRESGSLVKIDSTGLIVLKKGDLPGGKRIYGPIYQELRFKNKFSKVLSLAPLII